MASFGTSAIVTSGAAWRTSAWRFASTFLDELPQLMRAHATCRCSHRLGRSYGDSGLNGKGRLIDMTALDRVIAFDARTGVLRPRPE